MWISNNRFLVDNMFCAAALWGLWKLRNDMYFQGTVWRSVLSLLLNFSNAHKLEEFNAKLEKLRKLATSLPSLPG